MKNSHTQFLLSFPLLFFITYSFTAKANNQTVIKLGMSTALTGPAKKIGTQLHLGSEVYFEKINKNGGINGAQIKLLVADDGYEPKKTVTNTRHFISNENVVALFGAMGTPTSHAVTPILEKLKTPYLMPFSGAEFLHTAPTINVFNIRASYYDEAKIQIKYLVEEKKHTKIGFLIQADEFGYVVETGLLKSLSKYNLKPVKVARYLRNTHEITQALEVLKSSGATAISLVGTYKPLSVFINTAYEQGYKPDYTSISFAPSSDLFANLKYSTDLMVTEVVPNPFQCKSVWCTEFLKDMKNANVTTPNRLHFEGYLNAVFFSLAAQHCPQPLENTCLMTQLNKSFREDQQLNSLFLDKNSINGHLVYRSFFSLK